MQTICYNTVEYTLEHKFKQLLLNFGRHMAKRNISKQYFSFFTIWMKLLYNTIRQGRE